MTRSAHCNSHYAFFSTTNYTNFSNLINTCHSRINILSMCEVNLSAQQNSCNSRNSWSLQTSEIGCSICCTSFWYGQSLLRLGTWASRPRCREAYNTDVDVVLFLSRARRLRPWWTTMAALFLSRARRPRPWWTTMTALFFYRGRDAHVPGGQRLFMRQLCCLCCPSCLLKKHPVVFSKPKAANTTRTSET